MEVPLICYLLTATVAMDGIAHAALWTNQISGIITLTAQDLWQLEC